MWQVSVQRCLLNQIGESPSSVADDGGGGSGSGVSGGSSGSLLTATPPTAELIPEAPLIAHEICSGADGCGGSRGSDGHDSSLLSAETPAVAWHVGRKDSLQHGILSFLDAACSRDAMGVAFPQLCAQFQFASTADVRRALDELLDAGEIYKADGTHYACA